MKATSTDTDSAENQSTVSRLWNIFSPNKADSAGYKSLDTMDVELLSSGKRIPATSLREKFDRLLQAADTNGDGVIDRSEWITFLRFCGVNATDNEITEEIERRIGENDQTDFETFESLYYHLEPQMRAKEASHLKSKEGLHDFFETQGLLPEVNNTNSPYDYCIVTKRKVPKSSDACNVSFIDDCKRTFWRRGGRSNDDFYVSDMRYSVFHHDDHEDRIDYDHYGRIVIEAIKNLELEYASYYSDDGEDIFTLIRIPTKTLRKFATDHKFELLLDPSELEKHAKDGDRRRGIGKIYINEEKSFSEIDPFSFIYGRYIKDPGIVNEKLYWRPPRKSCKDRKEYSDPCAMLSHNFFDTKDTSSPFRQLVRLQLLALMFESRPENGNPPLHLRKYLDSGKILGCFALHDPNKQEKIWNEWFHWLDFLNPFHILLFFRDGNHVRFIYEYFGAKTFFYFRFVMHYSKWLIFPSFIGTFVQIFCGIPTLICPTCQAGQYDTVSVFMFSIMMSIWSKLMLLFWAREEKRIGLACGTLDYNHREHDRPDFKGVHITSFINGSHVLYSDPRLKVWRQVASYTCVCIMLLASLSIIAGIYYMRRILYMYWDYGIYAQVVASIANAIQIAIFNILYWLAACQLNNFENHRTDSEYEDALISKLFFFQFVNSYSSCYFIAFIAPYMPVPPGSPDGAVGECGSSSCMLALSINLGIIFSIQFFTGSILKVGPPFIIKWFNKTIFDSRHSGSIVSRLFYGPEALCPKLVKFFMGPESESEPLHRPISTPEFEYLLAPHDIITVSIYNYMNIIIQFGYMALFTSALPMAGIFVLLFNMITLLCDVYSFMYIYQRALPRSAENIGLWHSMFSIVIVISVITNAGISTFTVTEFNFVIFGYTIDKAWVFVLFQWVCFWVQSILPQIIPDTPWEVNIQQSRQNFLVSKILDKLPDELSSTYVEVFKEDLLILSPNDTEMKEMRKKHNAGSISWEEAADLKRNRKFSVVLNAKFNVGDYVHVLGNKCDCEDCKKNPVTWKIMSINDDESRTYNLCRDHHDEYHSGCLCWAHHHPYSKKE